MEENTKPIIMKIFIGNLNTGEPDSLITEPSDSSVSKVTWEDYPRHMQYDVLKESERTGIDPHIIAAMIPIPPE